MVIILDIALYQDMAMDNQASNQTKCNEGQHIEPQSIIKPTPGTIEQYLAQYIKQNYTFEYPEELIARSLKRQVHMYNNAKRNIKKEFNQHRIC